MKDSPLPPRPITYGIDITGRYVAIVRARRTRSGVINETLLEQATADPAGSLHTPLTRIQSETALDQALVAAAMPANGSSTRWLSAPFSSSAKARKVFPSLLDIQLPFPLEQCVYGFPVIQSTPQGETEALAIAAQREAVQRRLDECAQWNLNPHSLQHEGWALWGQHIRETGAPSERQLIIYLGLDRTVWVAGDHERYVATHTTQTGSATLTTTSPPDENPALRSWRDRMTRFYRTQFPHEPDTPLHIHWTGPGAADTRFIQQLTQWVAGSTDIFHFTTHRDPGTFLARALAEASLRPDTGSWNIRTDTLTHPALRQQERRAVRQIAYTAIGAGVVLAALNIGFNLHLAHKDQRLQHALTRTAEELTGLPSVPKGQERMLAERAIAEQSARLQPLLDAFAPSRTAELQDLLAYAREHDMRYTHLALRTDELRLYGTALDWAHCEQLAYVLRDNGWTVRLERQETDEPERTGFRLTGGRET